MKRKQLCKVKKGEMISGVCMGFSHYFDIDVSIIRLIFVAMLLFGMGSPVLVYFVLAIVLPTADPDDWEYVDVDDDDDYYSPERQNRSTDTYSSGRSQSQKDEDYYNNERRKREDEGVEAYGYEDNRKNNDERYR